MRALVAPVCDRKPRHLLKIPSIAGDGGGVEGEGDLINRGKGQLLHNLQSLIQPEYQQQSVQTEWLGCWR